MIDIRLSDWHDYILTIPDKSIDAIITDLPYGTTACKWDNIIPFEPMWEQAKRVLKDRGAFVTTASQPFTSALVMSNVDNFKYCWVWEKSNPSNIALSNKQPMKYHEDVCVFYLMQSIYNKQMIKRESPRIKQAQESGYKFHNSQSQQTGLKYIEIDSLEYDSNFKNPSSIIKINSLRPNSREFTLHPTQKPVAMYEYLIRTYTNEGDTVMDFCCGSGTTAVACVNTGRNFTGCDNDEEYYKIAMSRVEEAQKQPTLLEVA